MSRVADIVACSPMRNAEVRGDCLRGANAEVFAVHRADLLQYVGLGAPRLPPTWRYAGTVLPMLGVGSDALVHLEQDRRVRLSTSDPASHRWHSRHKIHRRSIFSGPCLNNAKS